MTYDIRAYTVSDYQREVRDDAIQAIKDGEYDYADSFDEAYDDMWCDDSITGNGSGSYFFNSHTARRAVVDMVFSYEARTWVDDYFGQGAFDRALADGEEALDVTFRCVALGEVAGDIREAWDARKEEEEE